MSSVALSSWDTPASHYPLGEAGNWRIHRGSYRRGYYHCWGVRGYTYFRAVRPLPITELQELRDGRWRTWMVDDPPQWWAMKKYAEHVKGRVLVAGLGLGLVCHTLMANDAVTAVHVVERSPEVGILTRCHLPDYMQTTPVIRVFYEDFYKHLEVTTDQYDAVIVDLWVTRSAREKMLLYYKQVLPLFATLRYKYPKAKLVFHGFVTVSDIKPYEEDWYAQQNKALG